MMNRHQGIVCPRLHMGCGESLHSQLLIGTPRPFAREAAGKTRRKSDKANTARGRTHE